jgi:hypothetical protein
MVDPKLITAAIDLGIKVASRFFTGTKKEEDLISVGLAVGYFYNFLEPVSQLLKMDNFQLYKSKEDPTPRKFSISQLDSVDILLPKVLNVYAFERCEEEYAKSQRGIVHFNSRIYGVNYILNENSPTPLTLIDLARPVMAIKHYYEVVAGLNTQDATDVKWIKTQISEISAFKSAISRLQERGYGALINKLDFKERG